jgi:hypothetical protein
VLTADAELKEHLVREDLCRVTKNPTPPHDRGFSKAQEDLLRRRARSTKSENEKWNEIYRILFPNDDEEKMPSPCQSS